TEDAILSDTIWMNATLTDTNGVGVDSDTVEWHNGSVWNNIFTIEANPYFNVSIDTTKYADGDVILKIKANDTLDNYNETQVAVNIDNNPPYIDITNYNNWAVLFYEKNISVFVEDVAGNENTSSYRWKLSNESFAGSFDTGFKSLTGNTTFYNWYITINTSNYSDGNYTLWIYANDTINKQNSSSINISMDNGVPNITINRPGVYEDIYDQNYLINVTIEEENENNDTYKYRIYNASGAVINWILFNSSIGNDYTGLFNTTNYSDGNYTIYINASDLVGNYNDQEEKAFTIDNNRPKVAIQTPQNNSNITGFFYFNATIIDDGYNGNTSTYKYGFDAYPSTSLEDGGNNIWYIYFNVSTLGEGSHNFRVVANDSLSDGTVRSNDTENISLMIDDTKPILKITSHANETVVSRTITIEAVINDTWSGIYSNNATFDGTNVATWVCSGNLNNKTCSGIFNTITKSDGENIIKITANDWTGHINSTN
ncbi:MAG: hypothetical protein KAQ92_05715, partial [Candidatus Aenigmarchaeota archaeon]|nr:hypothetical protein [Candidatus Aenigmarchaeota archaeon]